METNAFSPNRALRMLILMLVIFSFHRHAFRFPGPLPEKQVRLIDVEIEKLPPPPGLESPLTLIGPQSWLEAIREWLKDCQPAKRELIRACDFRNIRRKVAPWITPRNGGGFNLGQVCDIYDNIFRNWVYIDDPANEDSVFPASESIQHFHGDCDDFTALTTAALLSIGGEVRVNYVCGPSGCHAFPEVKLGAVDMEEVSTYLRYRYQLPRKTSFHYQSDAFGNYWLNLDWWAPHPGGPYLEYYYGQRFYLLQRYCEEI